LSCTAIEWLLKVPFSTSKKTFLPASYPTIMKSEECSLLACNAVSSERSLNISEEHVAPFFKIVTPLQREPDVLDKCICTIFRVEEPHLSSCFCWFLA
jgi:hypothetical protein